MLAQNERFQAQKKLAIVVTGLEGISFSAHTTDEFSAFEETWVKPQSIGRIVQSLSICIWGNVHYLALYQQMVEWLGLYNLSLNARDNTKVGQAPLIRINGFFIYWEEADNGTGRWDCPLLQVHISAEEISTFHFCVHDLCVQNHMMEWGVEEQKHFSFLTGHGSALFHCWKHWRSFPKPKKVLSLALAWQIFFTAAEQGKSAGNRAWIITVITCNSHLFIAD